MGRILPWAGMEFTGCSCAAIHLLPWSWHSSMDGASCSQELLVHGEVPALGIPHLGAAWGAWANLAKSLNPLLRPVLQQTTPLFPF